MCSFPRGTWADGNAYDDAAAELAAMFRRNFEQFAGRVPGGVRAAGARIAVQRPGPTMGRPRSRRFWLIAVLAGPGGCEQAEKLQDRFRALTPYEEYKALLAGAGLDGTALAKDWTRAGRDALDNPVTVTLPFRESGHITPERPAAVCLPGDYSAGSKTHLRGVPRFQR